MRDACEDYTLTWHHSPPGTTTLPYKINVRRACRIVICTRITRVLVFHSLVEVAVCQPGHKLLSPIQIIQCFPFCTGSFLCLPKLFMCVETAWIVPKIICADMSNGRQDQISSSVNGRRAVSMRQEFRTRPILNPEP